MQSRSYSMGERRWRAIEIVLPMDMQIMAIEGTDKGEVDEEWSREGRSQKKQKWSNS
jgi:hypothetical protein